MAWPSLNRARTRRPATDRCVNAIHCPPARQRHSLTANCAHDPRHTVGSVSVEAGNPYTAYATDWALHRCSPPRDICIPDTRRWRRRSERDLTPCQLRYRWPESGALEPFRRAHARLIIWPPSRELVGGFRLGVALSLPMVQSGKRSDRFARHEAVSQGARAETGRGAGGFGMKRS